MKMAESLVPPELWPYEWCVQIDSSGTATISEISPGLAELYGYSPDELRSPDAWRGLIPAEEQGFLETIQRQVLDSTDWQGRVRISTKDGDELIVETTVELDRSESGTTVIKGRVRDVTEQARLLAALEEREARLKILNESVPLVMWSCDQDLHFTWSWGSGLSSLGLEENEVVGMTLYEYFSTSDPTYEPIAAELRALQGETVDFEIEWQGHHYRCSVEPHFGPVGEVLGTFGTAIELIDERSPEIEETKQLGKEIGTRRQSAEAAWDRATEDEIIEVGPFRIDVDSFQVRKNGAAVELTPIEFRLLVELARRPGRVVTRQALLGRVWGHDFLGSGSLITMAVSRLRNKIEDDPHAPTIVETVRGVGYRLHGDGAE
jgi:PAS domain S-box-containing protein